MSERRPIRVLPPDVVDQIAAGEVVERPASVVKELVENALDAGARRIAIEVVAGGADLVAVEDDGRGIPADELVLALSSHATSKLSLAADLFAIRTLGFRGEALASIASISRLRLASCVAGADGAEVLVEGAVRSGPRACGMAPGTRVEVRDLFWNVPARRKFLAGSRSETARIKDLVERMALAHGDRAWHLVIDGRAVLSVPKDLALRERYGRIFDAELAGRMMDVSFAVPGVGGHGLLAPPDRTSGNRRQQLLFMNGRVVTDAQVQAALAEAYKAYLAPRGRSFPVWAMFLDVDPTEVDVNVHPRKEEVRILAGRRLFGALVRAAQAALGDHVVAPSVFGPARTDGSAAPAAPTSAEVHRDDVSEFVDALDADDRPGRRAPLPQATRALAEEIERYASGAASGPSVAARAGIAPRAALAAARPPSSSGALSDRERTGVVEVDPVPTPTRVAVQVHGAFIVHETPGGLEIIDQHALHEKILYNQLRAAHERGPVPRQALLVPIAVPLDARAAEAVLAAKEDLTRIGLELGETDAGEIEVRSMPAMLGMAEAIGIVQDLADRLVRGAGVVTSGELVHDALAMMACKAAVKAGEPLDARGIARLLDLRDVVGSVYACPHGRPTAIALSREELEKRFGRR